ncbi:MAG: alpha/beta fold hydrolase [Bryobacteraceae bacterium]|nr:alpha/beta fold hydrolase [Bryobacteraceae bacterium]
MPEMRLLLFLVFAVFTAAAQAPEPQPVKPAAPSPLIFSSDFLRDIRAQDIEALSAAIRLELQADLKAPQREPVLTPLIRATEQSLRANNNNVAWIFGSRLLAFFQGVQWGPHLDQAISLDFALDRRVLPPGSLLHARLERLFRTPSAPDSTVRIQFTLSDSAGKLLWQSDPLPIPPENSIEIPIPARTLAPGEYTLAYSFFTAPGKPLLSSVRTFRIDPTWRARESALDAKARELILDSAINSSPSSQSAFQFIQWTIQAMALFESGQPIGGSPDPHPIVESWAYRKSPRFWSAPFSESTIRQAEAFAAALQSGANPLDGQPDLRLAFRSSADQSLRTFRLYLPASLPAGEPVPLVVLLHGFAGDESSWLDRLPGSGELVRRLASERRFAVLAPSARSHYSRFDGPDAADLEQLKSIASRIRPIDPDRIALIGHGPAAFAAVNAALASSREWPVAVGIAGIPTALPAAAKGSTPRLLFEYAAGDTLFAASEARKWAYLLQKRIPGFQAHEIPDVDNAAAPAASIERAIAFFLDPPPAPAAAKPPAQQKLK